MKNKLEIFLAYSRLTPNEILTSIANADETGYAIMKGESIRADIEYYIEKCTSLKTKEVLNVIDKIHLLSFKLDEVLKKFCAAKKTFLFLSKGTGVVLGKATKLEQKYSSTLATLKFLQKLKKLKEVLNNKTTSKTFSSAKAFLIKIETDEFQIKELFSSLIGARLTSCLLEEYKIANKNLKAKINNSDSFFLLEKSVFRSILTFIEDSLIFKKEVFVVDFILDFILKLFVSNMEIFLIKNEKIENKSNFAGNTKFLWLLRNCENHLDLNFKIKLGFLVLILNHFYFRDLQNFKRLFLRKQNKNHLISLINTKVESSCLYFEDIIKAFLPDDIAPFFTKIIFMNKLLFIGIDRSFLKKEPIRMSFQDSIELLEKVCHNNILLKLIISINFMLESIQLQKNLSLLKKFVSTWSVFCKKNSSFRKFYLFIEYLNF